MKLRDLISLALILALAGVIPGSFDIAHAAPRVAPHRAAPRPLTSVSLVHVHQHNLATQINQIHIEPIDDRMNQFRLRQPGHSDVVADNFNSMMRTLSERQKLSHHEALHIIPDFDDEKQLDLFSARLKVKRPFYFATDLKPSLEQAGIEATRRVYETDPIRSIAPIGEVIDLFDGRWAHDLSVTVYRDDGTGTKSLQSWTVRVLSTLKDLVLDVKNYILWAHSVVFAERTSESLSPPTAKEVVQRALKELAANSNIGRSELRKLITVQLNQVEVASNAIMTEAGLVATLRYPSADDPQ